MGYRDDLLRRFRQDGLWDELSSGQQKRFQGLTEDQARQMMVLEDQWNMGEEEVVQLYGLVSLVQVITAFGGRLVEHHGEDIGRLSEAGSLLAEFILELRQQGTSADEIDAGLRKLSPLVIAALIAVHQGPSDES